MPKRTGKKTANIQCSGSNANGKRCGRMIRSGTYCYQHKSQTNAGKPAAVGKKQAKKKDMNEDGQIVLAIQKMTVKQLKEFAAAHDISLRSKMLKAEIRTTVLQAVSKSNKPNKPKRKTKVTKKIFMDWIKENCFNSDTDMVTYESWDDCGGEWEDCKLDDLEDIIRVEDANGNHECYHPDSVFSMYDTAIVSKDGLKEMKTSIPGGSKSFWKDVRRPFSFKDIEKVRSLAKKRGHKLKGTVKKKSQGYLIIAPTHHNPYLARIIVSKKPLATIAVGEDITYMSTAEYYGGVIPMYADASISSLSQQFGAVQEKLIEAYNVDQSLRLKDIQRMFPPEDYFYDYDRLTITWRKTEEKKGRKQTRGKLSKVKVLGKLTQYYNIVDYTQRELIGTWANRDESIGDTSKMITHMQIHMQNLWHVKWSELISHMEKQDAKAGIEYVYDISYRNGYHTLVTQIPGVI